MPSSEVFKKWKSGDLHSGSKKGPVVRNHKQAIAIKLSEERKEKKHGGKYPEKTKKSVVLVLDLNKGLGEHVRDFVNSPSLRSAVRGVKGKLKQHAMGKRLEGKGFKQTNSMPSVHDTDTSKEHNVKTYSRKSPNGNFEVRSTNKHGGISGMSTKEGKLRSSSLHTMKSQAVKDLADKHIREEAKLEGSSYEDEKREHETRHDSDNCGCPFERSLVDKSKKPCSLCYDKHCVRVVFKSKEGEQVGIRACPVCNYLGSLPIEKGE